MARIVCQAAKQGIVKRRGNPTIAWYKDGVPQYYCRGWIDMETDEPLEVCRNCIDHIWKSSDDYDKWNEERKMEE